MNHDQTIDAAVQRVVSERAKLGLNHSTPEGVRAAEDALVLELLARRRVEGLEALRATALDLALEAKLRGVAVVVTTEEHELERLRGELLSLLISSPEVSG